MTLPLRNAFFVAGVALGAFASARQVDSNPAPFAANPDPVPLTPPEHPGGAYVGARGTAEALISVRGSNPTIVMPPWLLNERRIVRTVVPSAPATQPGGRLVPPRLDWRLYLRGPSMRPDQPGGILSIDPMPQWRPPPGSKAFQFNGGQYWITPLSAGCHDPSTASPYTARPTGAPDRR